MLGGFIFLNFFNFFLQSACICVNYVLSLYSQMTHNMKTQQIKNRDEWRALNLKIAQHQKVIKINSAAGQIFSDDYLNWLNDLISRRNYLTTNGGF